MPYVYSKVDKLAKTSKVGNKQCVALIQHYTRAGRTATWREGTRVRGQLTLEKGTAIATFVDGRYPNKASGNHAAFYLKQDATGIWVMDQWANNEKKPTVSARHLPFCSTTSCIKGTTASDDGDAYSVIE